MVIDLTIALGSVLVFIPAVLSVWLTHKTNRMVRTNHGKTIGEHVERVGDNLNELNRAFDRHTYDDVKRFDEVLTLLKDQDKAATAVKQDLHTQAADIKLALAQQNTSLPTAPVPVTVTDTPVPVVLAPNTKDS